MDGAGAGNEKRKTKNEKIAVERHRQSRCCSSLRFLARLAPAAAQNKYDLLLQGGHVIDPRNGISGVRDVAISGGKIAAIAPKIDPAGATKTIDARGLFVTPGLVDIHTHVYAGTGEKGSYAGDNSVYPDVTAPRAGVTTVVDAGGSGWRNFDDFKQRIIDRSPRPACSPC